MTNGYNFKNGLFLAVSRTMMPSAGGLLKSEEANIHHCQVLLDFCCWTEAKTGNNIGSWLEQCHKDVGCKPNYITSHIVDGAANVEKSVQTLQWNTSDDRLQKIIADGCDAHKINTTASMASGTSKHVDNLNPELGKSLMLLHGWLVKFVNYKAYQDVLTNVRKEHGREQTPRVASSVVTRWNSSFDKMASANANQHDLDISIRHIVAPGGVREKVRDANNNGDNDEVPSEECWKTYAQYEGAILPVKRYSKACETANVIVHEELFWVKSVIETLNAPWFLMYKNVSESTTQKNLKVSLIKIRIPILSWPCF